MIQILRSAEDGGTICLVYADPASVDDTWCDIYRLTGEEPKGSPIDVAVSLSSVSGNIANCNVRLRDSMGTWRDAATEEVSGSVVRIMSAGL